MVAVPPAEPNGAFGAFGAETKRRVHGRVSIIPRHVALPRDCWVIAEARRRYPALALGDF